MCSQGLQSQCETTQVREQERGATLLGYTKLYGQVPGGQAELLRVPQAHYGPIKVPEGPPDERFLYLSDVLQMSARIARHLGARVITIDLVPERLAMAERNGIETVDAGRYNGDVPNAIRELTGGRGPDSVIDAVGMEAHGSPFAKAAHTLTGFMPDPWRA